MVERRKNTNDTFFQARLYCIRIAKEEGFDLDSDSQIAPWVREGVTLLNMGVEITPDLLDKIDRYGGTDHPDPWFT